MPQNMHFKIDIREKSIVAKGLLATYGKKKPFIKI